MLDVAWWHAVNLTGWPAWRKAETLEQMGALVVRWLAGQDRFLPWHIGPPDSETAEIVEPLRTLNQHGLMTTNSQPGVALEKGIQRAWVSLLASPAAAQDLVTESDSVGLIAMCEEMRPLPATRVPITMTANGRVVTATDGASENLFLPGRAKIAASQAWNVTIIDPEWGRKALLWDVSTKSAARHRIEG